MSRFFMVHCVVKHLHIISIVITSKSAKRMTKTKRDYVNVVSAP